MLGEPVSDSMNCSYAEKELRILRFVSTMDCLRFIGKIIFTHISNFLHLQFTNDSTYYFISLH